MVQTAKDRTSYDSSIGNCIIVCWVDGDMLPNALMWTALIEIRDVLAKDTPKMILAEQQDVVEEFAP